MIRKSSSVCVSLSGLDGSGKSSQAERLAESLRASHQVDHLWVPFNLWPQSMLRLLPWSVRHYIGIEGRTALTVEPSPQAEQPRSDARRPARGRVSRMFWHMIATLAAISSGMNLRRQRRRLRAPVVVLDRYRLDSLVKLKFFYPDTSTAWLARIVGALAPAPDIEVLIRVAPEAAYGRKPEQYNVHQLTRQTALYDELSGHWDHVVVIDGEGTRDEVAAYLDKHLGEALVRG